MMWANLEKEGTRQACSSEFQPVPQRLCGVPKGSLIMKKLMFAIAAVAAGAAFAETAVVESPDVVG